MKNNPPKWETIKNNLKSYNTVPEKLEYLYSVRKKYQQTTTMEYSPIFEPTFKEKLDAEISDLERIQSKENSARISQAIQKIVWLRSRVDLAKLIENLISKGFIPQKNINYLIENHFVLQKLTGEVRPIKNFKNSRKDVRTKQELYKGSPELDKIIDGLKEEKGGVIGG